MSSSLGHPSKNFSIMGIAVAQWFRLYGTITFEVKLPSACSFIVDGLAFFLSMFTLHVSAYMAIFMCV
jgi:hypothetical protein